MEPWVEQKIACLESNVTLMSALFAHLCEFPPHGPFAYLSAIAFRGRWLQEHPNTALGEDDVLVLFSRLYKTKHLADYPAFYLPSLLQVDDIDAL